MKALSILQPWAWLIVTGHKDIENRSWPTKVRERIWVHAGKTLGRAKYQDDIEYFAEAENILLPSFEEMKSMTGGLVGSVDIVDCVRRHASHWKDPDSYGFVLKNELHCTLVPYRGQLGFFEIDGNIFAPPNPMPQVINNDGFCDCGLEAVEQEEATGRCMCCGKALDG